MLTFALLIDLARLEGLCVPCVGQARLAALILFFKARFGGGGGGVGGYKAVCSVRGLRAFCGFLSFGLWRFLFYKKGNLDSKGVVLCKNLESKSY